MEAPDEGLVVAARVGEKDAGRGRPGGETVHDVRLQ
jgi:hypothetical protein